MSTKNLARTIIEGGRCGYYKREVQEHASSERASGRDYLRLVARDPEAADAMLEPIRKPAMVCFSDKISPVYAYLDSRVGKNWNKTFAEVRAKFDLRTTPGRHVTNDHMLAVIAMNDEHKFVDIGRYYRYFVDRQGILRKNVRPSFRGGSPLKPFDSKRLVSWLGNRKVGQQGARFVWWVPVAKSDRIQAAWEMSGLKYVEVDEHGEIVMTEHVPRSGFRWEPRFVPKVPSNHYRPAGLLRGEDEVYFLSLPDYARRSVLAAAPSHGGPRGPIIHESRGPLF